MSAVSTDPFDLDIVIIQSSQPLSVVASTGAGCGATCGGHSCISSSA
ncbi:FxLD family lanthipeptide [Streptomyces iconiensis]